MKLSSVYRILQEDNQGEGKPVQTRSWATHRFYIVLILIIIVSLATVFALSYNSAHGTIVQLVSASRENNPSAPSTSIETLTYRVEVHVWSWGATLQTSVNKPTFNLDVDNHSLPISDYETTASFQAGSYLPYHLVFSTADKNMIQAESTIRSSTVVVSMVASVTAGLYTEQRMASDSRTISW